MPRDPHRQDETWWERELLRNQKLMDQYQAVFESEGDWAKLNNPEDVFPTPTANQENPPEFEEHPDWEASAPGNKPPSWETPPESFDPPEPLPEAAPDPFFFETEEDDCDYTTIKEQARTFGVKSLKLRNIPDDFEVLRLSGAKVGANLAGGHGLGYARDSICGNIVKCKWALADCEFCREILCFLNKKTGRAEFWEMAQEAAQLAAIIRERIVRLRARSPWPTGEN